MSAMKRRNQAWAAGQKSVRPVRDRIAREQLEIQALSALRRAQRPNQLFGSYGRLALPRFLRDESGTTAIEYGLIVAGIALVLIPAIQATGASLKTMFQAIASGLAQ
jgi:pilus assembly protein Flp/PilA